MNPIEGIIHQTNHGKDEASTLQGVQGFRLGAGVRRMRGCDGRRSPAEVLS